MRRSVMVSRPWLFACMRMNPWLNHDAVAHGVVCVPQAQIGAARMGCPGNGVRAIQQGVIGLVVVLRPHGHSTPQHGAEWGGRDQHLAGCHSAVTQRSLQNAAHMLLCRHTPPQVGGAEAPTWLHSSAAPWWMTGLTATRTPSSSGTVQNGSMKTPPTAKGWLLKRLQQLRRTPSGCRAAGG